MFRCFGHIPRWGFGLQWTIFLAGVMSVGFSQWCKYCNKQDLRQLPGRNTAGGKLQAAGCLLPNIYVTGARSQHAHPEKRGVRIL
jgi:hypothetical protein